MRVLRVTLAVFLAILLPGAFVGAQETAAPPATGTITGMITDPQSVPLPGAAVEVKSVSRQVTRVTMTDAEGKYEIKGLPPATDYVLKVSFSGGGFATVTQDRIVVRGDKTTTESMQLYQERVEEVIVSGKHEGPRVVDLDDIGQSTHFSAEFVEALPLLGRNFQDVLTLSAGVVDPDNDGNPNVLGGRAENFQVLVDGVSNQDPLTGTFLSNINTDAIEDFEVIQSGADASFSRGSAGFANIVTKSGTNEFEGTFTLSYRSSSLDGNGMTGEPEVDFSQIRPALNISGPIVKDRLWYFFSDEEFQDQIPVNTLSGRGTLIREVLGRRMLAKLTWSLNPSNKLTASVRSDPLDFTNLGVNTIVAPEAGFTQTQGGPFYLVDLATVFSPTLLLSSTLSFQDTQLGNIPTTAQDPTDTRPFLALAFNINQDTQAITGAFPTEFERDTQRLTWREDVTVFVEDFFGRHDIIFGSRFEREHVSEEGHEGIVRNFREVNNLFAADGNQLENAGRKFFVNEQFGIPQDSGGAYHREGDSDILGFYVSDTWRPHENVVLSLGVRVDMEKVSGDAYQPFDVRGEYSEFQRFLAECQALGSAIGDVTTATHQLLAERFPEDFPAYMAQIDNPDDDITLFKNCLDGRAWFYTFPKETFTEDCFNGTDGYPCTNTLKDANLVRQFLGDLAPQPIEITNRNLAPRFQVSWDPWGDQKTKLFGSWNRFYDKVNLTAVIVEQGPDFRSRDFEFTTGTNLVTGDQNLASDPTVTVTDRDLRTEFNDEWTIGFEREIAPETRLRLQYTSRRFRDQLQDVDYNHYARDVGPEYLQAVTREVNGEGVVVGYVPFGGEGPCQLDDQVQGYVPSDGYTPPPGRIVRLGELREPNGTADDCFGMRVPSANGGSAFVADGVADLFRRNPYFNNVLFLSNLNYSSFEGVTLEFTRRLSRNWQLQASWTHGRAVGAADNFQDESGSDPSLVDDEFGYTGFDIRDVVTVSATTILPWELNLGTIMTYFSGTPYSVRELDVSLDNLAQSTLRTTFPTGGRNDQRNESRLIVDVSIEKQFLIKKYNASAQLLIANLFADDFLLVQNFVNDRRRATRDFGRNFEIRFRLNF